MVPRGAAGAKAENNGSHRVTPSSSSESAASPHTPQLLTHGTARTRVSALKMRDSLLTRSRRWRWRLLLLLAVLILASALLPSRRSSSESRESAFPLAFLFRGSAQGSGSSARAVLNQPRSAAAAAAASAPSTAPTAVCLVGGARTFEATGPSIVERMLPVFQPADVFVHAPLDHDAAKLWALGGLPGGAMLAGVRIFSNLDVDEFKHPRHLMRADGSPNAVQGLLQYFRLVEGCVDLIQQHEALRGGVEYTWVVRARLDSYWARPPPALRDLNASAYTIPYGADNGGFNDRFGAGGRRQSFAALRRLSMLKEIDWKKDVRDLNSEMAYMLQMEVAGVPVVREHVPFCVLSRRLPRKVTGECEPAMNSIESTASLDGAKCLACSPCGTRPAEWAMKRMYGSLSLPMVDSKYVGTEGLVVCNYSTAWVEGQWQQIFDRTAGLELAQARSNIFFSGPQECIQRMSLMKEMATTWDGPDPEAVCLRRHLGVAKVLGKRPWTFPVLTKPLVPSSMMFSIHADRKPMGFVWESELQSSVRGSRVIRFNSVELFHASSFYVQHAMGGEERAHQMVDVIRIRARGLVGYDVLQSILTYPGPSSTRLALPVCQLVLLLPGKPTIMSYFPLRRLTFDSYVAQLRDLGFVLDTCLGGQRGSSYRCLFFSLRHCKY